tara:strand:- start:516 stop:1382 length:867 start_codon:yes stop_codon:yes gene_type:complete
MKTIIGLGKAGCNIADSFSQYPQYKIYKIDTDLKEDKNCFNYPSFKTLEEYESNCPSLKKFFRYVKGEVLFITSCGKISAASLRILEQLKNKCDISVLYVRPDRSLLSELKALNDNLIFGVLQQYARSGLFKRAYLVDNIKLSEIVGDVPLREHYNSLNQLITSTIHMVNVFNHSKSEIDTFDEILDVARISTFSIVSYENNEEKVFFDLDIPRQKCYYYGMPEELLKSDGSLMKNISEQLKILKQYDKIKVSYGIYSTNYDVPYVYGLLNSSVVQNNNFRLDKEINL